jgi:hypothetical protein
MALQFGPGTLMIGEAGTEVDYSCLVNGATLTTTADTADTVTKLCGTQYPGLTTYTAELAANVDADVDVETDSLFQLSSEYAGTVQSFKFLPSTAGGLEARGTLVIMPLPFGAGAFGDDLAGDVTWATIGDIAFYRDGTLAWTQNMQPRAGVLPPTGPDRGAAAPGTVYPSEPTVTASDAPNAAKLGPLGYVAVPATVWTTGQKITVNAFDFYWDGTAWQPGAAA